VAEAERQIKLILDPPTAEVGQTYDGKVVNITKFGAFVNVLPGRDGLLHISKLGGGKRIDRVEDVLQLGDEVAVRVDDIDPNGKVSLSLVGADAPSGGGGAARSEDRDRGERAEAGGNGREYVSFEDSFDEEIRGEFGDLGPEQTAPSGDRGRGDGGRERGRGRGGDRGRGPRRRR
jgi:polyribonucleotide nucleotidyltransferase